MKYINLGLLLISISFLVNCGPEHAETNISQEQEVMRQEILSRLESTPYWVKQLPYINVFVDKQKNIEEICQDDGYGCAFQRVIYLSDIMTGDLFCFGLVHEYMHISFLIRTGNSDSDHVHDYEFFKFPNEICKGLE